MSNHIAIATVTAVLRKTLEDALADARPGLAGARVTTARPNAPQADLPNPGVNVFLYQSSSSAALRNQDLPRRRSDGTLVQRPQSALDLHYLLTFHGSDARFEPQILLGIATRALHEQPVMTRAAIESLLADPEFAVLQGSDLADALEPPRVSPVALSVEDMGKLWSIFYQIPYVLSTAYRASVVLIESDATPQSAPPVRRPRVRTQASIGPRLDRVVAAGAPAGPGQDAWILAGSDAVLLGERLHAAGTRVRFDDLEITPEPAAVSDGRIQVAMPATLAAGVHSVQVVHRRTVDAAAVEAASSVVPMVLHPTIAAQATGRTLALTVVPAVGRHQRVAVLLHEVGAPAGRDARAYTFRLPARSPEAPDPAATLDVPLTDVAPGSYLVRVQVDGAESPLTYDDAAGAYVAPKVTLT